MGLNVKIHLKDGLGNWASEGRLVEVTGDNTTVFIGETEQEVEWMEVGSENMTVADFSDLRVETIADLPMLLPLNFTVTDDTNGGQLQVQVPMRACEWGEVPDSGSLGKCTICSGD